MDFPSSLLKVPCRLPTGMVHVVGVKTKYKILLLWFVGCFLTLEHLRAWCIAGEFSIG